VEQVRTATEADVARLVELTAGYRAATAAERGGQLSRPVDQGGHAPEATVEAVGAYVGTRDRTALVGLLDEWVAGGALCRTEVDGTGRRGILDLCFVEPGAREVGLGGLLLEYAVDWFRAHGCAGVDGTALPGDREAKQFFESAGFKARLLVMHLPLD